ncbi:hypothetical protein Dimus_003861, partial [Dionaea muscipula]
GRQKTLSRTKEDSHLRCRRRKDEGEARSLLLRVPTSTSGAEGRSRVKSAQKL